MLIVRTIDDVVETIQKAKESGRGCALLLGSGCSATAGIPVASGFVKAIADDYPRAFARATEKTYQACMAQLAPAERRDLIARYIDRALPNWAHIGAAQLLAKAFVDRVLTVNFDPLLVRACSLVGAYPATYDFAASQVFAPAEVPAPSVFYLHGQRSGFVLMNTKEECERHALTLRPVFEDAGRGRVWIVVGYSGENDPVFDHLASVKRFDHNLYWIGYKQEDPPTHVRDRLLSAGRYAFLVSGFDADRFFIEVAQRLKCFPPSIVTDPFGYLQEVLSGVCAFPVAGRGKEVDPLSGARMILQDAKRFVRTNREVRHSTKIERLFFEGKRGEVITLAKKRKKLTEQDRWMYVEALRSRAESLAESLRKGRKRGFEHAWSEMTSALDTATKTLPRVPGVLGEVGRIQLIASYAVEGARRDQVLKSAESLLVRAARAEPGEHLYNLACAQARLGKLAEAKANLLRSTESENDAPGASHIESDTDLAVFRGKQWFRTFLKSLRAKPKRPVVVPVVRRRRAQRSSQPR